MNYYLLILAISQAWKPSEGLIKFVFVIGAFLIAGVALSIFTFYEDCYWGDAPYREYLKHGKKSSS
ncbi:MULTISPECIES: hypothetical protein [Prochlorococcus]|uniref:Uncharacterized protein n=1 Tax=Prochlorococcus marinus (strain SARG / CCMP1375 / SS120) TaxID=167539 RepID=Q7VAK7_PROMA|nr:MULTISPECIES: hypothetical protein [Prochlorococcus]AAQ00499.1 Predicted protein [Prochlorococcus marinus subsp. marinus str. CCMP1375]KGG14386.1 hypothetical protein EV04_0239 [Prochlorococcus marinus str. LG]KGG22040.1 hypothetical protein EV08_0214 [Prochlorococcus marinus str. SS2]KGG24642.1 hypothetical protein EV09_0274 [Prochlorococcus marinus str. SS35]KGG33535.1 hypothetical protein EV10_0744 [Prochlorococcus marinus str. SS51]